MRTTLRRAVAAAAVLPVLLLTAACGSDDGSASEKAGEKAVEKMLEQEGEGEVDVDLDGEEVTIETDEGTTSYGSTDRPESLPEDFPLPDGNIITSVDSPTGAMVSLEVEGDVEEVFNEVVSELEDQGWTREYFSESQGSFSAMMAGETDDESVMVSAEDESGEMTFVVSLAAG